MNVYLAVPIVNIFDEWKYKICYVKNALKYYVDV